MVVLYRLDDDDILCHYVILGNSKYCFNHLIRTSILREIILRRYNSIYEQLHSRWCYRAIKSDPLLFCVALLYLESSVEQNHKQVICDSINKICHIPTDLFKLMNLITHANNLRSNCEGLDVNDFYGLFIRNAYSEDTDRIARNKRKHKFVTKHKFIKNWYTDPRKPADRLLYVLTKYKSRCTWDHKTIIRAGHFTFPGGTRYMNSNEDRGDCNLVINYILHGIKRFKRNHQYQRYNDYFAGGRPPNGISQIDSTVLQAINIIERSKLNGVVNLEEHVQVVCQNIERLIRKLETRQYSFAFGESECHGLLKFHICFEHLPNALYNQVEIWKALVKDMPIIAMLRHISYIAYLGLLDENEDDRRSVQDVTNIITDPVKVKNIHPMQILKTIISYRAGRTVHGGHTWTVNMNVYRALVEAFRISFEWGYGQVVSQKKYMICVEASTRMMRNNYVGFSVLSGAKYALALAFALQQFSDEARVCACREDMEIFEDNDLYNMLERIPLLAEEEPNLEVDDRYQSDLSKPITEALNRNERVDAFVLFTTSINTSLVGRSPYDEFLRYRNDTGSDAKLIICAMEVTGSIIADPHDENVKVLCGGDKHLIKNITQFMGE